MGKFNSINLSLLGIAFILISIAVKELYIELFHLFLLMGGIFSICAFLLPTDRSSKPSENNEDQRKEGKNEKDS